MKRLHYQNFIIGLAKDETFPVVSYSEDLSQATQLDTIPARTVKANEIQRFFEIDPNQGQGRVLRTSDWVFELLLGFDKEVCLDEFTAKLENTTSVPASGSFPWASLLLLEYAVEHPVQQQPSSGTKARFRFRVIPHRS